MNLERKFKKELSGDLRKETTEKLLEIRKKPSNLKELKEELKGKKGLSKYSLYPHSSNIFFEFCDKFKKQKRDIFGKIFKTEKYKERVKKLNKMLEREKDSSIENIKKDYEKKFKEILKNSPLTLKEKEKYLSTENMEKMNLKDYLILLERLSGEAFYHVTRYGVRENTFMSTGGGHELGKDEFLNNFIPLLKNKNIKSATTTIIENKEWGKYFISNNIINQIKKGEIGIEKALDEIMEEYNKPDVDYFLDRDSTHFSYGKNLHSKYGAENNYKFFFYYPVEYILYNEYFHSNREIQIAIGAGSINNDSGINQQYNDSQVFNFGKGVPINAGILCITNVQVDPKTGSQYLLENGKPIKDKDGNFKTPKTTISSKEYWEKYFKENPELKPNKIIYGNFGTHTYESDEELINLAKSKEFYQQSKNKQEEFKTYVNSTRKKLRGIFKEIIKEKLNEEK